MTQHIHNYMIERFLKQTTIKDNEDYKKNLLFIVHAHLNFDNDDMDKLE